jgi:hypothetical protein
LELDSGAFYVVAVPSGTYCLRYDIAHPITNDDWCARITAYTGIEDSTMPFGVLWLPDTLPVDWSMGMHIAMPPCGDIDCNNMINPIDVIYLATYLFTGNVSLCYSLAADVNGDGVVNINDLTYLALYIYIGGPPPDCPPPY